MRELAELTDVDDPAWPELRRELTAGDVPVELMPVDPGLGRATLLRLQVTARSNLGGFALNCGGLLVDGGWLRVYGSPRADAPDASDAPDAPPSLAAVNAMPDAYDTDWRPDGGLVLAHDVLGGVFALGDGEGSERPGERGEIVYFAPDALEWEALGIGHSGWLAWLVSDGLERFYADLRWPGWRDEVAALNARQGVGFHPPLWSEQGRDRAAASRAVVPMAELLGVGRDMGQALGLADPGFLGRV